MSVCGWGVWSEQECRPSRRTGGTPVQGAGGAPAKPRNPLAPKHQAILLAHHGVICWGTGVEDAYFKIEILDTCCRTLAFAAQLPGRRTALPPAEQEKLRTLRHQLGMPG